MGIINYWLGSPSMMQLLITKLVGLLAWLSCVAVAQTEVSGTVTGFLSLPDGGLTCIGNLAIFVTGLLRGRFDLDMAARDVFASVRGPPLEVINGFGLATCRNFGDASVVMLSYYTPNSSLISSIKQFMRYISSAHNVQSIILQCFPLKSSALFAEICNCDETCKCILFYTVDEVTILLARRMPRTLKRLTDTLCILLSADCLRNGCHGCNRGLLYVKTDEYEMEGLAEDEKDHNYPVLDTIDYGCHGCNRGLLYVKTDEYEMERLAEDEKNHNYPVLNTIDYISGESVRKKNSCICIPVNPAAADDWTDLLIKSFKSKDKESRGVRVKASYSLENYMALGTGTREKFLAPDVLEAEGVQIKYSSGSLIVPRFIEMCLNLVLTGWFRMDGFSSSVIARRAIRDYLSDSKGNGFAANAFVTEARVISNFHSTCQVLTFSGTFLTLQTFSIIGGCVNLICAVTWAVLVAIEGKWHYTQSMPPSEPRVVVIMIAIVIGLAMDWLHLYLSKSPHLYPLRKPVFMVWGLIGLEMVCIVSCSSVAGALGIKGFGRWLYSVLQILIWAKWAIGSYLLGERLPKYDPGPDITIVHGHPLPKTCINNGILVYSSAFFLNAILAGVRAPWQFSQRN